MSWFKPKEQTQNFIAFVGDVLTHALLIAIYPLIMSVDRLGNRFESLVGISNRLLNIVNKFDRKDEEGVSRLYLIEIAFKNMSEKKTRTFITVGGMAIGISFIVFLVSIGYGLQNLVVTRIAGLNELKQIEVAPGLTEDLAITDGTIAKFKNFSHVDSVEPLITIVGRVSYQDSVSDIAVFATTTRYLQESSLQPVRGRLFDNNLLSFDVNQLPKVAGAQTSDLLPGEIIRNTFFQVKPSIWVEVKSDYTPSAKLLGYTRRVEGQHSGDLISGGWVKSDFLLWKKQKCNLRKNIDCENGEYVVARNKDNSQTNLAGYVSSESLQLSQTNLVSRVLGASTDGSDTPPLVDITDESEPTPVKKVEVRTSGNKEILVNRSVLEMLNIPESRALSTKLEISLMVVGELLENKEQKIESIPVNYEIIGVLPEEDTPVVYLPFIDVRSMGVSKFSQLKVKVDREQNLITVRSAIESVGYSSSSVADTVQQVEVLFSNFRILLTIVGMVALSVAALGMFNTLTVSLLERTREVGLMKAMGMKSNEVKSLFLTESIIMGFYGGLIGLIIGGGVGKLLSLLLSGISLANGVGFVDISYVPSSFVVLVGVLAIVVGVVTGYFPARRATNISALNALRYE